MLKSFHHTDTIEAGCDEAGRGCLAGPVFAAAVIFPPDYYHPLLNDSKLLNHKLRLQLRNDIQKAAIAWAVDSSDNHYIDKVNILKASIYTMHKAVGKLNVKPEYLIIDGNYFLPMEGYKHKCFVKGDGLYLSIAAASILAKTYRDEYMETLHNDFPAYNWKSNKGYGTLAHRRAIKEFGTTEFHRHSFNMGIAQLELNFDTKD